MLRSGQRHCAALEACWTNPAPSLSRRGEGPDATWHGSEPRVWLALDDRVAGHWLSPSLGHRYQQIELSWTQIPQPGGPDPEEVVGGSARGSLRLEFRLEPPDATLAFYDSHLHCRLGHETADLASGIASKHPKLHPCPLCWAPSV